MKIAKNMEAIFLVAVVLGLASNLAFATHDHHVAAKANPVAIQASDAPIQTVTITTKRLTAAEKLL